MDEQEVKSNFWKKKMEEYSHMLPLKDFDEKECKKPEVLLNEFISHFTERYGTENVLKAEEIKSYRRKEYKNYKIRVYFLDRKINPYTYFSISHESLYENIVNRVFIWNGFTYYSYSVYPSNSEELIGLAEKYINDYQENQNQLNSIILEIKRKEKIRSVARQSIRAIVEAKLAGTDYVWNLEEEDTRCVLRIKMKRGKMIEITLGFKSFTDKIPEMFDVIKQMEHLLETIPYPVNINSYGKNIKWSK